MRPVLFDLFGFPIYSYGVMILAAVAVAVLIANRRSAAFGVPKEFVGNTATWALIFGVLGARLAFILQELPYYLQNRDELFSLRFAGLTSFGGLLGGFLAVWVCCRRAGVNLVDFMDLAAPAVLVAHAVGRAGCLLNGCCYGGPIGPPLGVAFPGAEGLHHPAQLYDAAMNLAGVPWLLWLERRGRVPGRTAAAFFLVHGGARFVYEFWRAGTTSTTIPGLPITQAHVAAAAVALLGVGMWAWSGKRHAGGAQA
ncbi:MAG: prolipoprotein diacylglyceryl transferase [Fimbriimonadales bacterium]|nr:prolipoprotein diacylglyceryl transferase [Fimbriimonadales bacterium]